MKQTIKFILLISIMIIFAYLTMLVIQEVHTVYNITLNKSIRASYFLTYMFEMFIFVALICKFDKRA